MEKKNLETKQFLLLIQLGYIKKNSARTVLQTKRRRRKKKTKNSISIFGDHAYCTQHSGHHLMFQRPYHRSQIASYTRTEIKIPLSHLLPHILALNMQSPYFHSSLSLSHPSTTRSNPSEMQTELFFFSIYNLLMTPRRLPLYETFHGLASAGLSGSVFCYNWPLRATLKPW